MHVRVLRGQLGRVSSGNAPSAARGDGSAVEVLGVVVLDTWFPRPPRSRRGNPGGLPVGSGSALELGQDIGEPAVPGPEGLGLRRLGVAHDAEPVIVGVEADDAVIPDPELLSGAMEVDVLGRQAQESGIGMDGFLPLDGPAP